MDQQVDKIQENIKNSIRLKEQLLDDIMLSKISQIANAMIDSYRQNGKVLFCGNGGSAADAQHLSAELSGRYYYDRPPLNSEALHVNTSYITAVANDYSYTEIYARLVRATGQSNDVIVGLSTSGNSANIVNALKVAKELNIITVGFTGQGGGKMKEFCDYIIEIPSTDTPRIQECHMLIGHILCEIIESTLFPID